MGHASCVIGGVREGSVHSRKAVNVLAITKPKVFCQTAPLLPRANTPGVTTAQHSSPHAQRLVQEGYTQPGSDVPAVLLPAAPPRRGPVSLPGDGRNAAVGTMNN